jgi:hypothetical protein
MHNNQIIELFAGADQRIVELNHQLDVLEDRQGITPEVNPGMMDNEYPKTLDLGEGETNLPNPKIIEAFSCADANIKALNQRAKAVENDKGYDIDATELIAGEYMRSLDLEEGATSLPDRLIDEAAEKLDANLANLSLRITIMENDNAKGTDGMMADNVNGASGDGSTPIDSVKVVMPTGETHEINGGGSAEPGASGSGSENGTAAVAADHKPDTSGEESAAESGNDNSASGTSNDSSTEG